MMQKFKLIKEYPGSPKLGQIALPYTNDKDVVIHYSAPHPKFENACLAIDKDQIENQLEYWEEVVDIWYLVLLKEAAFRNAWEVIKINGEPKVLEHKKYFKTKEEAESFILFNKPCLSINDIKEHIQLGYTTEGILSEIYNIVKSKI